MKKTIESTTYEIIRKNGKPFMRMTTDKWVDEMMIYKTNTNKPYVRRYGMYFYLDEDMKKALA